MAHEPAVRLVLVDDHEMVIEGLKAMLAAFGDRVEVVGQAVGAERALGVIAELDPDIVLCDVRMQGSSGLDLCRTLRERDPDRKVVMLSVYDDEQYLFQALRVGASGYLLKSISSDELVRQLEFVHRGETAIDPGMAARAVDTAARLQRDEFWPGARQGLTQRESEILSLRRQRPVQQGHRHQAGDRRRDRQDAPALDLPQARRQRPHRRRGDGAAGGHLPVTQSPPPNAVRDLVDADRELALLRELIQAASSGPGVEPLAAAAAARMITAATATDVCFVHVLDDTERSLTLTGATPPFDSEVGKIRLPLGQGVSGWVASHREPVVIIHDKESDPRYMPFESLRGSDFTSMVSVPMETDPGGLVGVLNVHTVARREFTDRDVELLLVIGRLIAGAMHQARLHRQLVARERAHENFVEQVIQAQELERRRLAGDIHDGISQRLVTLSYRLDAASRAVDDPAAVAEQLGKARELVDLTLQEARAAIGGLRPPVLDDLGLAGGLASLARSIPQVDIDVDLADDPAARPHRDRAVPDRAGVPAERRQARQGHQRAAHVRGRTATRRGSKSSTTASVSTRSSIRSAATRWAATACCRWPSAPRSSAAGCNIRSRPGSGTAVTATIPLPPSPTSDASPRNGSYCCESAEFTHGFRFAAGSEVAGVAAQRLDRRGQRARLLVGHADVGEHLVVQRDGRVLDGRAAEIGEPHQRGAPVGRMRHALDEAVGLESSDRVRDAGDVHLQPVGGLRDRQRAACG